MRYVSTRGKAPTLSFSEVVIAGLASDGGLYVPETCPTFSPEDLVRLSSLSYQELMVEIIQPFVGNDIDRDTLQRLVEESYAEFSHDAIAPLTQIGEQEFILELYHGPTLAFKDFALQFLGRVLDYVLSKRKEKVTIIGATSGDTGSAAIEGCRHSEWVRLFIMHPKGRISDVQRRQMTTVQADNVYNLAVESDFDFCQDAVKDMFNNPEFLGGSSRLVAVNSINWCRIMAQIVYYFYAAFQLGAPARSIAFSVPTGNFGDIYAGYMARRMGLPIHQLIIATNANDILHRFIKGNHYVRGDLMPTLSPSMDIQVSSNFERLLYDVHDGDGQAIHRLMHGFKEHGIRLDQERYERITSLFSSACADDDATCAVMKGVYGTTGEIIDPHTAIGVYAARKCRQDSGVPMVVLSTAHAAKFPDAAKKSGVGDVDIPERLRCVFDKEERYETLTGNMDEIRSFIVQHA